MYFSDTKRAAIVRLIRNSSAQASRLAELIHRAIPYPVALMTEKDDTTSLSLAHKHWSKGGAGAVVIEDIRRTAPFLSEPPTASEAAFLSSLAIAARPNTNLYALYEDRINRVIALEAARVSGLYRLPVTAERARAVREGVASYTTAQRELVALRSRAEREKQLSRRVDLNSEIRRLEAVPTKVKQALAGEGTE